MNEFYMYIHLSKYYIIIHMYICVVLQQTIVQQQNLKFILFVTVFIVTKSAIDTQIVKIFIL